MSDVVRRAEELKRAVETQSSAAANAAIQLRGSEIEVQRNIEQRTAEFLLAMADLGNPGLVRIHLEIAANPGLAGGLTGNKMTLAMLSPKPLAWKIEFYWPGSSDDHRFRGWLDPKGEWWAPRVLSVSGSPSHGSAQRRYKLERSSLGALPRTAVVADRYKEALARVVASVL